MEPIDSPVIFETVAPDYSHNIHSNKEKCILYYAHSTMVFKRNL